MIRKLRRRMILLVLCGLLLASAGLVFAINMMNWSSVQRQALGILDMLAENGGQRPLMLERQWDGTEPPEMPEGEQPFAHRNDETGRHRGSDYKNAASLSYFYTVELDENGCVTGFSAEREDLYDEETVAQLAAQAVADGRESGRREGQFYRLLTRQDGYQLIVVDQSLAIQDAQRVLRLTLLVAVAEDALLSLGAVWLIRRMVKPVDEAMEKQKQFVWDASHELKTPLAVISANAEVLESETGPSKPLEYIQSEVRRTDQLVQSLLTLARMEKGGVQAQHVPFDLSHTVLSVALPFESAVFEAGKQLNTEVPDGIPYTGDPEMIKQLCVILLSNAQKYSNAHGVITLSLEARGDRRILKVHNTGPAIPEEAQEKIFDRFYRVDSSHNREIAGNGLGLAIAQSIVKEHKGKISVASREGVGTTFTVVL